VQVSDLWKLFEEGGGLLVMSGVLGQVWASLTEPEKRVGEWSAMVLTVGLMFSLASQVGPGGQSNLTVATLMEHASGLHQVERAGDSDGSPAVSRGMGFFRR